MPVIHNKYVIVIMFWRDARIHRVKTTNNVNNRYKKNRLIDGFYFVFLILHFARYF